MKLFCVECKKEFEAFVSQKRKFCSYACYHKSLKNKIPWNKGLPTPPHVILALRKANIGRIPWNKGTQGICKAWNKGIFGKYHHTIETRKKIAKNSLRGEKSKFWKGGTTSLKDKIRKTFEYRQWRSDVYSRDNFTCQDCGSSKSGKLEAHHIKEFAVILRENKIKTLKQALTCEELWNINNGKTLCVDCHNKTRAEWFINFHQQRQKLPERVRANEI